MNEAVLESVLTCPACGHPQGETMPTDACQFFHVCRHCAFLLTPNAGDCCVFCSFGTVKCPPRQANGPSCGPSTRNADPEVDARFSPAKQEPSAQR